MKNLKLPFSIIFIFIFNIVFSQINNKIKIALDPMHGGFDEGFFDSKTNTFEKDITFAVNKKIIDLLTSYENYEIIKLRTKDEFVPMSDKIIMASEQSANLYVAINCQTDMDKNKRGTQLFTLNKNKDQNAVDIAKRENEVINKENGSDVIYSDFKPDDPNKIFDAVKLDKKYIQLSKDFTTILRNELNEKRKFNDNGIIEGPFLMLHNVYMPSAIINIGYLSNPEDLEYLKSDLGQQIIAEAVVNSIITFKNKLDNDQLDLDKFLNIKRDNSLANNVIDNNAVKAKDNKIREDKIREDKLREDKLREDKIREDKIREDKIREDNEKSEIAKSSKSKENNKKTQGSDDDTKYSSSKYYGSKELVYRVQVLACYTCPSVKKYLLNKYPKIIKIQEEGYKKYFIFESLNIEEAKNELMRVRQLGFSDAFLIGYIGKQKVKVD